MTDDADNPRELIGPLAEHLDGDVAADPSENVDLTGADPRIVAEHLFLDGLLRRVADGEAGHADDIQARVRQAIATIEHRRRSRIVRFASLAAAAILVSLVLWTMRSDPSQTLEAIARYATTKITRQYTIETQFAGSNRVRIDLYAYGVEKFAGHIQVPPMPWLDILNWPDEYWFGTGGKEWWVVPISPNPSLWPVQVFVPEKTHELQAMASRFNLDTSFLQIPKMLPQLQDHYSVSVKTGPLAREWNRTEVPKPTKVAFVTCTLETPDQWQPERLEIEADFYTGTVFRMVSVKGSRRTVIDLVAELDQSKLALDWYAYDTHRDPDQGVIHYR